MSRWFAMSNRASVGEVSIFDEIGMGGISAGDFHKELTALGDVAHIALSINSPGGDVFAGLGIFNQLKRHKAAIIVTIDGIAASIASVIAMAGDRVVMPENAMMMLHDPSGLVLGNAKNMRDLAASLDKIKAGMISAYTAKTGMDRGKIAEMMDVETWMTAQEAVDMGFADSIEEPVKMAARFDLSKFRNAPAAAPPTMPAPKETFSTIAARTYAKLNGTPATALKTVTAAAPPPGNLLPAEVTARIWDRFNRIRV